MLVLFLSILAFRPPTTEAYLGEIGQEKLEAMGDAVLEVGVIPSPPPSRRQIIDADKGKACLQCHHMPYPIAPQKPEKPGEEPLSAIKVTPSGGLRLLTGLASPINDIAGGWSPDGKRIVYSVNIFEDDWDIWVMDADGRNRGPLFSSSGADMAPDWSPDGSAVVFQSNKSGSDDIWIIDIATNELTQCTSGPGEDTMPKWSPDGKKIVFQSNRQIDRATRISMS
jgi:hypothetical protein